MTHIYLASRYSRAPELRLYRTALEQLGLVITSRWIDGGHELAKELSTEAAHVERARFAQEDWADMMAADWVISFTEEPRKTNTRGGRHVEFGGALAAGKRCLVVGWRENVFHCLPHVEFFESWDDCLSALTADGTQHERELDVEAAIEAEARRRCFTICSTGGFLDPENGCCSTCKSAEECQGWKALYTEARLVVTTG